jgi:hypothetical protein
MIIYTTAVKDYDWFGTTELDANVGSTKAVGCEGKTIRKVEIPDGRGVDAQRDRYASGLCMNVDETEWKKLVDYKLVTLIPKAEPARLDTDGTAEPKTRLLGHGRFGDCQGPGITKADTLEDTATGKRTPLT